MLYISEPASAQNYPHADVSMMSTHHVLRGLIPVQFSDRGDAEWKTADCCPACGELSDGT